MDRAARWMEFDTNVKTQKIRSQSFGFLAISAVLFVDTNLKPWLHPLTLLLMLGLLLSVWLLTQRGLSPMAWRPISVIYVLLLTGALRCEVYYRGGLGLLWITPCSSAVVLVSALFMVRKIDYALTVAGVWFIFLVLSPELHAIYSERLLLIYVIVITAFGLLMNHSFISRTVSLMRARDEFRVLSETDQLTKLPNRRKFINELERTLSEITRTQAIALLVMLDVDHFKRINDKWGHDAGDRVLIKIADVLGACEAVTKVGRLGGEEFAVIVPVRLAQSPDDALSLFASRLIHDGLPWSLSAGSVILPPGADTSSVLIAADVQLYLAKAAGRHCIFREGHVVCDLTGTGLNDLESVG